ncbi:MAG: sugar transferase [Geminicoccaceae bacterium]
MLKRTIDIVVSAIALTMLSPLMVVVAFLVRIFMGSPVLFVQPRPGCQGRTFDLYKFRTMKNANGSDGKPLADHERMSRLGNFLRRFSLDEFPQLWNVLKGDMSLVGPRPLLVEYLERYTPEQARRHEVRPGITGLAQVSGRNSLPWEERFKLDVHYVDHKNLVLDLDILMKTALKLIRPEGINQQGHAIGGDMFMGSSTHGRNARRADVEKAA